MVSQIYIQISLKRSLNTLLASSHLVLVVADTPLLRKPSLVLEITTTTQCIISFVLVGNVRRPSRSFGVFHQVLLPVHPLCCILVHAVTVPFVCPPASLSPSRLTLGCGRGRRPDDVAYAGGGVTTEHCVRHGTVEARAIYSSLCPTSSHRLCSFSEWRRPHVRTCEGHASLPPFQAPSTCCALLRIVPCSCPG